MKNKQITKTKEERGQGILIHNDWPPKNHIKVTVQDFIKSGIHYTDKEMLKESIQTLPQVGVYGSKLVPTQKKDINKDEMDRYNKEINSMN